MKLSGHEINSQLRQKLEMPTGRHLYVVLGTYERLERYEKVDLTEARSPSGQRLGDRAWLGRHEHWHAHRAEHVETGCRPTGDDGGLAQKFAARDEPRIELCSQIS